MADTQIKITADTRDAERNIRNLESALAGLQQTGEIAGRALGVIATAAAGISAALGATLVSTARLIDTADNLNMTADALRNLQQSASLAGVDADQLNQSLFRLSANLGEALIKGAGPAKDALDRIGVSLQDVIDLPADQQLAKITQGLNSIQNQAERTVLSKELLGLFGPKILKAAEDLEKVRSRMEALGLALTQVDSKAIADADDAITKLKDVVTAGLQKALAELAPYIIAVARRIEAAITAAGGFEAVLDKVKIALKLVGQAAILALSLMAAAKFVAIATAAMNVVNALITMARAFRTAGVAAATMQAIATGGLSSIATLTLGVGAAIVVGNKAMEAFGDLSAEAANVQLDIKTAVEETAKQEKVVTDVAGYYTDQKKKAVEALDQVINRAKAEVQYQKDIAEFGETEARIRKTLAEEENKLKQQGLSINDQLFKSRLNILETALREEAAIRRSNTLQKEQAALIIDTISATTMAGKAMERLIIFNRQINEGLTREDIERQRQQEALSKQSKYAAISTGQERIKTEINQELAKYNELLAADIDYQNRKKELAAIEELFRSGLIIAEAEDYANLQLAKTKLLKDYQRQQEILTLEGQAKALNAEISHQERINEITLQIRASQYKTLEVLQSEFNRKIEIMELDNQVKMQNGAYNHRKQVLDLEIQLEQGKYQTIEQLERDHQLRLTQIRMENALKTGTAEYQYRKFSADESAKIAQERVDFEKKTELQKTQFFIEQSASIMNSLGQSNRKAFEAAKAFNIANAVMNTYMGATKALATYPPPFNFIAAAAVVAMGLAQVSAIRSQQYSGRQLGGPVMGNQSYIVGENGPELFTPATTGRVTRNQDLMGKGDTNVNFYIQANDTTGFDELLTQRRGLITQIIRDAQLERGVRGAL